MFHIPMSSPMMKRMLGFLSCACAGAPTPAASPKANVSSISFCIRFMVLFVKGGRPLRAARRVTLRLLPFVVLHRRVDLLLHRIEVERGGGLHRRILDRRHGKFCHLLLDQNEAPEFAGHEVIDITESSIVEALVVKRRCSLKRIL